MPRPPRTDFPGAWHHVMNRGADHRDIFQHDVDYEVFLDSLALAAERSALEFHAYCLMTNHFHLLMQSREGQLAEGMQFLSGRFTRLINLRVGRDIHLNPVVAHMTSTPEAWPWSSAAAYSGMVQPNPWLKTCAVFDLFGPDDCLAVYREFMAAGTDLRTREFYAGIGW